MKALFALAFGLAVVWGNVAAADSPFGLWRLNNGKVTVRVSECGGLLCATIVSLAQPLDKRGKPKVDHENPNPALRNRRVVGLQVAQNMKIAGQNRWKGRIYNADDGGTYRAEVVLSGKTLSITGCWGPICKKNRFVRLK